MRQYLGGGRRGPWQVNEPDGRLPFQRADGSVMTHEEIARVATTEQVKVLSAPEPVRRSPELVWATVERLGTQTAAAREMGVKQGSIQSALRRYMRDHGITGPMPGLLTVEQIRAAAQQRASDAKRALAEPTPESPAVAADEPAAAIAVEPTPAAQTGTRICACRPQAESTPALNDAATALTPLEPVAVTLHHGDPAARAEAFNEGLVAAMEIRADTATDRADAAIDALVTILGDIGPTWTDADAERWLKALTATVDLVYPTRAA